MAWRVRFVAAKGLSLVSSIWKSQTTKDGFSAVACDKLEELRNKEKDHRVLEGLRGGQVSWDRRSVEYGLCHCSLMHTTLAHCCMYVITVYLYTYYVFPYDVLCVPNSRWVFTVPSVL